FLLALGAELAEGIDGVAGPGAADLAVIQHKGGVAGDGEPGHREADPGGRGLVIPVAFLVRVAGGDEEDTPGAELDAGAFSGHEVAEVGRVERAAENDEGFAHYAES